MLAATSDDYHALLWLVLCMAALYALAESTPDVVVHVYDGEVLEAEVP